MLPLSVVPHLSGPFDLQYDEVRELVYVADYHSSVIRVLDLRRSRTPTARCRHCSSPRSASRA